MRSGAVLTLEECFSATGAGSYTVSDDFVLRDSKGQEFVLDGSLVRRAIHAGKVRAIPGTKPTRYEFKSQPDE